ncbi:MAG: CBS domain-containing protein [Magnetococcales bacterium]|nr:CBS domain-containing protein [Magnetococcales bacterium]NGZ26785.1 CBS domain-containing protein [Magnetococcales bacterium]
MTIVRDCMFRNITTLSPNSTLWEAMTAITRQAPGFAVVLERMELVGLVTEYDMIQWIDKGLDLDNTPLSTLSLSTPQVIHESAACQEFLRLFNQRRIRRFPVLNEDGILSGGVMEKQILSSLPRSNLLAHYRVSDLIPSPPPILPPSQNYQEVTKKMVRWHRGCVLVVENEQLTGIVTEGDLVRARLKEGWSPQWPVVNFMNPHPVTIEMDRDLLYAMDFFRLKGHRRLAVIDNQGKVRGLLTQTDLLKQMVHSARSRQAILNPEDIAEPAFWFDPLPDHPLLAYNEKGGQTLGLDQQHIGQSIRSLAEDPELWDAISIVLRNSGTVGPLQLPLRTTSGARLCLRCRFSLIPTPTGEDRIFCTVLPVEGSGLECR